MAVYLIHFDRPLCHARHYLGFCRDGHVEERMHKHRAGRGARILAALGTVGIGWRLVRTWEGESRSFERRLKGRKAAGLLCPECRAAELERRRLGQRARREVRKRLPAPGRDVAPVPEEIPY